MAAKPTSFDSIIAALGGVNATARAIGRRPSQVCQWRRRFGQFPAETYFAMQKALKRAGVKNCPREAFRFDDAPGSKAG